MDAYRLEFGQADVSRFQHAFTRLHGLGIDVGNLDAIREQDPDYIRKFYELFSAARDGWPDPDPDPAGPSMVPMTNVKRWLDETVPTAFFVASHRGRYIAFTSMFSIGTAVHPEYRRKGIATLLKAGSIADAHCRGFRGQTSSTASPGMKRVFEGLGYRRTWSEIRLIRSRC
jgi:GNAT superfamily N-acetyltransferase